jgi:hypothetical protein
MTRSNTSLNFLFQTFNLLFVVVFCLLMSCLQIKYVALKFEDFIYLVVDCNILYTFLLIHMIMRYGLEGGKCEGRVCLVFYVENG